MDPKKTAGIRQIEEPPIRTDPERQYGGPQSGLPPNFIVGSELAPYLIVGIDFGTGFCRVCTFTNGAPYAVPPRHFRALVEDTLALNVDRSKLVHSLKHCIADNYSIKYPDHVYSAVEITGMFLTNIKAKVEQSTERLLAKAVIGVPACFNHRQRNDLIDAAMQAGINILGLINEPTAAALHAAFMKNLKNGKYLILSSGAYSFEASIVDLQNKLLETKSIQGDRSLSGNAVTKLLAAGLQRDHGWDLTDQLHITVDKAKKDFDKQAAVVIDMGEPTVTLQRNVASEYLAEFTHQVSSLLNKLITSAQVDTGDISGIVLTGEGTKLWALRELLVERFPNAPACSADISAGAAIYAAQLVRQAKDWVVWDAIANSIMVAQADRVQQVIAQNSPLPINGHCNLSPDEDGVTEAVIYQRSTESEEDMVQVAKARLSEQLQHTESGASVDLSVMATASGTLSLSARHKELDVNLTVELVALTEQPEIIDMWTEVLPTEAAPTAPATVVSNQLDPGFTVEKIDHRWFVQSVVENSTAAQAGINVFDEVISIDDVRVIELGESVPTMLTITGNATESAPKKVTLYRAGIGHVLHLQCTEPTDRLQPLQLKVAIANATICGDDRRLVQSLLDYASYDLISQLGDLETAVSVIKRAAGIAERAFGIQDILYIRALCDACTAQIHLALLPSRERDPFAALAPINKDWEMLSNIIAKHPFLPPAGAKYLFNLAIDFQQLRKIGNASELKIEALIKWALKYAYEHRMPEPVRIQYLQTLQQSESNPNTSRQPAPNDSNNQTPNPPISEETTGES